MVNKYSSAFYSVTNGGDFYGEFNCEFFYCFVHSFILSKGCFACGRKRYVPSARDMLALQSRYCFALRNSDIFALGEHGGKYADINPRDLAHAVRSRAEGTCPFRPQAKHPFERIKL